VKRIVAHLLLGCVVIVGRAYSSEPSRTISVVSAHRFPRIAELREPVFRKAVVVFRSTVQNKPLAVWSPANKYLSVTLIK
jgi:hypothetical protein